MICIFSLIRAAEYRTRASAAAAAGDDDDFVSRLLAFQLRESYYCGQLLHY